MANPMKGEATVLLSTGKTLTLVFDFETWVAAEDILDRSIDEILDELQKGKPRLRTQRGLILAGLQRHHPEITIEEVGPLFIAEAAAFQSAIASGVSGGLPRDSTDDRDEDDDGEAGDDAAADPPRRARGTGTRR